jgi:agmatine deiminase
MSLCTKNHLTQHQPQALARRLVLQGLGAQLGAACLLGGTPVLAASAAGAKAPGWRMPDEAEPHRATWMAFGASSDVWGERLIQPVREHLAGVARAIAAFEPVNMLVREREADLAARLCGPKIKLFVQPLDDLWMRDSGPVFVTAPGKPLGAVDFNFNGWGEKQAYGRDAKVAAFVADKAGAQLLTTDLVLEGGGIEVDGHGTAIITESCVLNRNRNPGLSKAQCEAELGRLLGLRKIIWLPGIKGRDITDGHTDFYARFTSPGVVVAALDDDANSFDHAVTRRHLDILRRATDARGQKLRVVVLKGPDKIRPALQTKEFSAGYINFYVCNGAVITPQFGDATADANNKAILRELFPKREVVELNVDAIAAGGGGIHCATQQQPL